jgi:hypothetical protein
MILDAGVVLGMGMTSASFSTKAKSERFSSHADLMPTYGMEQAAAAGGEQVAGDWQVHHPSR